MVRRDDLLVGPKGKAIKAIKAGKTDEALRCLDEVQQQFRRLHDSYSNSISLMLGELLEARGDKWFETFERARAIAGQRERFQPWKAMTPEQRVDLLCNAHRSHYSEFHVEEDDEKFVVVVTACGAGGRLVRDGIARRQNAITTKAYPWSFNRVGFPLYCAHAYFFNELWQELGLDMEYQWGRQYDDQGKPVAEPCRVIVRK